MKTYNLTVTFPLNVETMTAQTKALAALLGQDPAGTGTWLVPPQMREVDFDFGSKMTCEAAAAKVKEAFPRYEVKWVELDYDGQESPIDLNKILKGNFKGGDR